MLEVALTPAAVSCRKINQRRGTFFITAGDFGDEIHLPPGPADEGSLNKIMAHNGSAKWWLPRQVGQTGMRDERFGANNGIVAPITTIAKMPVGQAGGQDGSIHAGGKLVRTGKEGVAIDHQWQGLYETCIPTGFHGGNELYKGLPGHQTVRIQHHHILIAGTPALAKIGDIPRFASEVFAPVPVEDAPLPLGALT